MPDDSKTSHLYENLPIPSYEEATSSRPVSSQSRLGPEEASDDAERQGLLRYANRNDPLARTNYQPPSAEAARESLDSLDGIEQESDDGLRQEMQQMDVEDPNSDRDSNRSLLGYRLSKRFTTFTNSFSSLHIPSLRRFLPKISWPQIDFQSVDQNRVVILGRLFGAFLIVGVMYVLIASDVISFSKNGYLGQVYNPEAVRTYVQSHVNKHGNIQDYLKHITGFPHVAGTEGNFILGEWVAEVFKQAELEDVTMERFDVYLNYPRKGGRRVAIVKPEDQRWEAMIEEDHEDTLVFHGHSKSGDVTGPLIFANYGSLEDFKTLSDNGIPVKDSIVLVRYYGSQTDRALKVKAAEMAGAIGCIIYSEPSKDQLNQDLTFHKGQFMPEDAVQRGTVALTSWVVGDVLSPGWASTPGEKKRDKPDESAGLNQIPSIPLAWRDAKHLLESLKGHGKRVEGWQGVPNVEYWSGDNNSPDVNLKNLQDEETYQPIYNILGRISGWEQPDKRVIVGNHRDAWCLGASDPGSGTAIMLEVVRIFGELRQIGWRPLRTIEFASWDAEEYNLVGSTEHVENRMDELRRDGYAYLNVDVGVGGRDFHASASPIFERALLRVLDRTTNPFSNDTLRFLWDKANRGIEGLGAGSDHVAFQDIVGTSSIDLSFQGQEYPYHSCYDNFDRMATIGDEGFYYHQLMGQVWALLILEFADEPLLPFDMSAYARAVAKYVDGLRDYVATKAAASERPPTLDLSLLQDAAETFAHEAAFFHEWDAAWSHFIFETGGMENKAMEAKRISHNNRMANFETHLLDLEEGGGLPNRTQFKHVIFAPQAWSGYEEAYFPGVRDALDVGDWEAAQGQVEKAARILKKAALKLNR